MTEPLVMGACLDETGVYRYSLTRRWGSPQGDRVLFVMLNPSTADAQRDDPTIRKCIGYAKAWGCASLEVVNLFAFRDTSPLGLLAAVDPVGPDNDTFISSAAKYARQVVMAHGTHSNPRLRRRIHHRARAVRDIVSGCGHDPMCFGVNSDGTPKHPLYLKGDLRPVSIPEPQFAPAAPSPNRVGKKERR